MYDDSTGVNEKNLRSIQKIANMGFWTIDLAAGGVYATPEAKKIYGIQKDKIEYDDIKSIPLPEYRKMMDEALSLLVSGDEPYDIEFKIRRADDGEIRDIHSIAEYDPVEKLVSGVFQDVTEQKQMELRLVATEERFKSLFDNSTSGIMYMANDGSILEVNRRMLNLLGSPSADTTRQFNVLAFPLLVEVGFSADFRQVLELRKDIANSIFYKSAWGTEHYLEYHLAPIIRDGIISGVIGTFEEVTARVHAEERINSLLKEKDIILREVHHRIKNNMASIEGLLRIQADSSSDERVGMELKDAVSRLGSMRVLYEKLYESEEFLETSSKAYLSKLIDDIADVFPECGEVCIEKKIDDFSIPTKLSFSLGIIINELFTNALKYAFTDAASERLIRITAVKTGRTVNICVRDNGIGFPEINEHQREGFGLQLINMLSEQIGGSVGFHNDGGAVCEIIFDV